MIDLHLGAHKTASTHLQHTLHAHRAGIAGAGIAYLGPPDLRGGLLRLGPLAAGEPGAALAARKLRARISGARRVLISEENILGTAHERAMFRARRFYPDAAERLGRVLAGAGAGSATLHLALRDPAGFMVSAYCQRLYGGVIENFDTFRCGCDPTALQWSELVARLTRVPDVAGCVIWRYEDWPEVAPQVLAGLLPAELASRVRPEPGVTHPGLSQRAHKRVMQALAEGRATPDLARRARKLNPKSLTDPVYQPFGADALAGSGAAYAQDLARIGAMPGVTLLRREKHDSEA